MKLARPLLAFTVSLAFAAPVTAQSSPGPNGSWEAQSPLARLVETVGFSYDPAEDVLYSRMNAWQRPFGYCRLFDLAAPLAISAIIHCEPIYFTYGEKDWMIELWKGQYGLETGGEVGIYNRPRSPLGFVKRGWYASAQQDELMEMSFVMYKNDEVLFERKAQEHWWLTGFRWGELSEPEELRMDVRIELPSTGMCQAFTDALLGLGYTDVNVSGTTVNFQFDDPRMPQPLSMSVLRGDTMDRNRKWVSAYNALKTALELESNDPNLIWEELCQSEVSRLAWQQLLEFVWKFDASGFTVQGEFELATEELASMHGLGLEAPVVQGQLRFDSAGLHLSGTVTTSIHSDLSFTGQVEVDAYLPVGATAWEVELWGDLSIAGVQLGWSRVRLDQHGLHVQGTFRTPLGATVTLSGEVTSSGTRLSGSRQVHRSVTLFGYSVSQSGNLSLTLDSSGLQGQATITSRWNVWLPGYFVGWWHWVPGQWYTITKTRSASVTITGSSIWVSVSLPIGSVSFEI